MCFLCKNLHGYCYNYQLVIETENNMQIYNKSIEMASDNRENTV